MDKTNKWDILLADIIYGMNKRPHKTYEEDTWAKIKTISYKVSKEADLA